MTIVNGRPSVAAVGQARRRRLPNWRAVTETSAFARGNGEIIEFQGTVGLDELARRREILLFGAKAGTDMAALLADAAVLISVSHGVTAEALRGSVSRVSQGDGLGHLPGSVIGAALDLVTRWEIDGGPL